MRVVRETREQAIWRLSFGVEVDQVSRSLIHYNVKDYLVAFDKRKHDQPWSCTCVHGSLYRGDKEENCRHIDAVKRRMRDEGKPTW